jgi:LAS superfamily LD-carboxypeptidase LdcB
MLRADTYRRHTENNVRAGNNGSRWLARMSRRSPAPQKNRGPFGLTVVGVLVGTAAVIGAVVSQADQTASSSTTSPSTWPSTWPASDNAPDQLPPDPLPAEDMPLGEPGLTVGESDGAVTAADGDLPDGVTSSDTAYPGVANLDPDLLRALRAATADAAADGVDVRVNSGWRSVQYQEQLLRDAVVEYGSQEEAARWVATPSTSPHVSGDAVDVGGSDATAWLSEHGSAYGLCQNYANESWHYELRPEAVDGGCAPPYPDPTHDPRMQ